MGRPVLVASTILLLVGLAIGGLWAATQDNARRSGDVADELAALRDSEAARRPSAATQRVSTPALCRNLTARNRGAVSDAALDELSGLVLSRRRPNLFWAIEDSGAAATLSAIRDDGTLAGNWAVPGAENVDWEDIATGPGPSGPVLYAADIGDNDAERDTISVYRVPEPANPVGGGQTAAATRLSLRYPDGAHDAETLLVDPVRGTLVIVTKSLGGGSIYAASPPLPFGAEATLRKVGPATVPLATGGDVSANGKVIAVRGYFSLSVWARRGREPITEAMKRAACVSPTALTDGQGEALAVSKGGATAWTVAEGTGKPIVRLQPK